MNRKSSSRRLSLSHWLFSASLALSAQSLYAQNSDDAADKPSRVLEEVMVTAQKRDEAVQDVPISMSVMTNDFMVEQGVTDLREALLFVPNVQVEQAGFFAAPRARGFTFNNNNKAFEPPLGLAIDGLPYTRIPYFLAATFDLSRIEVLRGPQGTTFGKNTTAGLIHILTANPTDEWSASFSAQAGDYERERYEASIAGPIIDDVLRFRLAVFDDTRDGFISNTTAAVNDKSQPTFRGHDRSGYRFKLDFPNLFGSYLKLSYEDVELEDLGTGFEIIEAPEAVKAFLLPYDPNADYEQGNNIASLDDPDGRQVNIETVSLEWNVDLADWGLVLAAGHSVLENNLALDTDFTPAPAIFGTGGDSSPTDTVEFRVVSPIIDGFFGIDNLFGWNLGSTDFVAGVFYQERAINDSFFRFVFDMPTFLGLTAAADGEPAAPIFALLPPLGEDTFVEDVTQSFDQQAESLATFAEFKWHFAQDWTLQLGMRNGTEKKNAHWEQYFNQPQPAIILPQAGMDEFTADAAMEDDQFQHKIALNWQPTDNLSFFIHRAEGVKGGGFNAFAFSDAEDELQFGPEFTTEWSFNAKTNWLDNTLRANVSVFRMDVDDFQVLTRAPERTNIGLGVTIVKNAAQARSQGVEGDIHWLINNWFSVLATIGYNETEYLEFTDNECPPDQDDDPDCGIATGKPFPFAPKWNNTLTGMLNLPLFDTGLELTASATVEQFSEQFLDVDLDERKLQDGFERYKASLGIAHPAQGWSLKVIGENLNDQHSGIRQGDLFSGVFVEIAEQPKTVYAQFNWNF